MKLEDGEIISIGGSMAYIEDVAADRIVFHPLDNYIVSFSIGPLGFDDYRSFVSYLEDVKGQLRSEHLYVSLDLALDSQMKQSDIQELTNEIGAMYMLRDFFMMRSGEEGAIITLDRVEVGELHKLSVIAERVTTSRVELIAGFESEPGVLQIDGRPVEGCHLSKVEDWV